MNLESKARINSLISAANATTGKADTDLTSAVGALIAGFGQGGGGGFTNIEVVTIASSFTTADAAYSVFSSMVTNGETTYFVRKSKSLFDAVCLSAYFNLPTSGSKNGYARHRTSGGVSGASSWTPAYDLRVNAGDEYYKVVIS